MTKRTTSDLPDKYKTCDWLWNYGHIGLTEEHIKRLNSAINTLESLNEHTDVRYIKEIKDKLLEVNDSSLKHWKPSEKQINALSHAVDTMAIYYGEHYYNNENHTQLKELLKQLKALV